MVIERGASNTLVVMARETLSPSYWLLHFNDPDRNGNAYCIVQAGNATGAFITLTFSEVTSGAVATSGQVTLSPPGNWQVTIYEQTSSSNLNTANANRLVYTQAIFVEGGAGAETGWTDECPSTGDECDPLTVEVNGTTYGTLADPCGATFDVDVVQDGVPVGSLVGGEWVIPSCGDLNYSLENSAAMELESGTVPDPCGETLQLIAPDGSITFDGLPVGTVPSGDTTNLDCGTTINSAHVTLGGSTENGIYYISGTAGGKTRYEKNATHAFEYSGTRWELIRPGSDHQAALGNETYPWLADWTATGIAVDEGTISQYCGGNVEPCADLTIAINGTTYGTVADPCGATAAVNVHDSNGNDVGSLVSGAWVVAPPANVLHEYTTGGTWNKPTDPSFKGVWVFAAGAGGSGGAGNVNATSITGASGGGGGAIVRLWIPAASLGLTETYAIGAGGAGVASGNGGAGGATLFGAHVDAKGGSGGGQGSGVNPPQAAGGSALLCTPLSGSAISGAPGGRGRRETAQALAGSAVIASVLTLSGGSTTSPIATGGAGGGGGGGWLNSIATGIAGGDGGGCYQGGSLTTGGAGGAVGGSNGTAGANDIYLDPFLGIVNTTIGLGTGGGGGGGASGATAGGTGAAGGRAAGGGGGGSTQTGTRGAGGAGGNGFLLVYEVFAI